MIWDALAARPGFVIPRERFGGISKASLTVYISQMRGELIEKSAKYRIDAVRGVGYVLVVLDTAPEPPVVTRRPKTELLPMQTRKFTSPPCSPSRPRIDIASSYRSIGPMRRVEEKTKSQLREELRQAVENTR